MATAQPIPFIGKPGQRGTATGDSRYVNALFEIDADPAPGSYPVACIKRPGLANSTQPPAGAATGRGVYAWSGSGNIYSVFADKIYSGTTDLGVTLAASTGRVWFAERHVDTGTRHLIVSDGADNYNITTADGITQIDENDDAQYPAANLGPIVELDGYLFQAQSDGQIWNTDLNSAVAWTATSFLTADTFGSDLEAIARQKDQIIAFTKNRVEFFFNNGNPTGSPLLRIDQNTLGFGIASKNSLAFSGETLCFVGENSADGDAGRAVWIIQSLGKVRDISPPHINRVLAAEGASISSCTAWMERVAGQLVYVLNLSSADRTFVYSVDSGYWCEWSNAAGTGRFPGISATSLNGTTYIQDAANGRVYTFPPTTFQDSGTNFTVTLQTARSNFGSAARKTESALSVVGDTTTGNLGVATSDDDYTTFTTARNIDMAKPLKRLTQLGSFYSRSHRFTYTANDALRLQAYIPEIIGGAI
jgi:hypothetical protein